jgi:hypothetical protein
LLEFLALRSFDDTHHSVEGAIVRNKIPVVFTDPFKRLSASIFASADDLNPVNGGSVFKQFQNVFVRSAKSNSEKIPAGFQERYGRFTVMRLIRRGSVSKYSAGCAEKLINLDSILV